MNDKRWKFHAGALLIGLVCFAPAHADAQVARTRTRDGATVSSTTPKASAVLPDAHPAPEERLPSGVSLIYSNFGTGRSVYDAGTGWTEAGQEANDEPIAEAMSFIPDSNYTLLRIDAALTYVSGTNGVRLVLAQDNGGVPGKIMFAAAFTGLPTFGTCCVLQTVTLHPTKTNSVELTGGQTYWIYPLPADTTSYLVWNYDTTNVNGNGAVSHDYGKSWTATTLDPFGAFDVYGTKTAH